MITKASPLGRALAAGLLLAIGLAPPVLNAAPQTFNTALPVAEGNFVYRQQLLYLRASDDPGPADRDLRIAGAVAVLGYGVNSRFAVFGALPLLDKRLELTPVPGQMRIRRDTRGLGELRVFGRYTLVADDAPGRTARLAVFGGIETPTGKDDDRDPFGRLPQPLQAGSGSWDPFVGVVGTWQTLDWQLDAQIAWEVNREANDFEFGDRLMIDGAWQNRLWPRELGPGLPGFLYGALELNLVHAEKNRVSGRSDPDSGGQTVLASPGLQYVTRDWIIEGIVQVPLVQSLNGLALKQDFSIRAGFRRNF